MINEGYDKAMPNHLYIILSKSIVTYAQIAKRTCCKLIIHFIFSATVVKQTSQCWQWVRSPVITFDSNCGLSIAMVTTPYMTTTISTANQITTEDITTKVIDGNLQESTITDSMGNITSNSSHGNMTDNSNNANHSNQGTRSVMETSIYV